MVVVPRIVDFCSGAGGPIPTIEKVLKYVNASTILSLCSFEKKSGFADDDVSLSQSFHSRIISFCSPPPSTIRYLSFPPLLQLQTLLPFSPSHSFPSNRPLPTRLPMGQDLLEIRMGWVDVCWKRNRCGECSRGSG